MNYETHHYVQGTPEWHAHRNGCFNGSELAVAQGISSYEKRDEFIARLATGVENEVTPEQQARFDKGHYFESLARPLAEKIIGQELFPATISTKVPELSKPLSSSLDGSTMDRKINWEHKTLNAELEASLSKDIIPPEYHPQMEQGMMINGATRCLFSATKWDKNGNLLGERHVWYESSADVRKNIIPTWKQLEEDIANYKPAEYIPTLVAEPQQKLPAVVVNVEGVLQVSHNLVIYGDMLREYIKNINTEPKSDKDFADLNACIKTLKEEEDRQLMVKGYSIAQVEPVDQVCKTIDTLHELTRNTRLALEKVEEARKKMRKAEIINNGEKALAEHVTSLNQRLGNAYMPVIKGDFAGAVKRKSSFDSMQMSVNDELARKKIEANEIADRIEINLKYLRENASEHRVLFNDTLQIILKAPDDLQNLVKSRISDYQAEQAKKLEEERERIRKEEEAKAKAKADTEKAAEIERVRQEERAKAQKEAAEKREAESKQHAANQVKTGGALPLKGVLEVAEPIKQQTEVTLPVIDLDPTTVADYYESIPAKDLSQVSDADIIATLAHFYEVTPEVVLVRLGDMDLEHEAAFLNVKFKIA